jgi:hypothetical protein
MRTRALLVALPLLLVPSSCLVTLTRFTVPQSVASGALFEVAVEGTARVESGAEDAGAVLQLPLGFTVRSAGQSQSGVTLKRDDPMLLALYRAESGHALHAFSGRNSTGGSANVVLRVVVEAPPGTGTATLKVALAGVRGGVFVAQDPAGVTDFAQIAAATHAQQVTVTTRTSTDFTLAAKGLPYLDPANWGGVAFDDVDGDGRDDVAGIARLGDGPHVYLAQRDRSFVERSAGLRGSSGRSDVAFGDFDGDGLLDLADGNGKAWLGDGGASWTLATNGIVLRGGGMEGVAVGDVDGDGRDDVAFSGHFSGYVQVFLSRGRNQWQEASSGLPNSTQGSIDGGHKLLLRDVTGDGLVDVVWSRYYQPNVWSGDGRGNWTAGSGFGAHQFWGIDAGDLDGDGRLEIVAGVFDLGSGLGGGGIQAYWRTGPNQWGQPIATGLPATGGAEDVALADFDRDGVLDLVAGWYGTTQGISLWRGNGDGTFAAWTQSGLPETPVGNTEGIAVGDINGDTFPDIGIAIYGQGLGVWINERTGFSRYGEDCRGTLPSRARIGTSGGAPQQGNAAFAWTLQAGPPGAPVLFWGGFDKRFLAGQPVLPLSLQQFGAPGCVLLAPPIASAALALDPSGRASFPLPIPNDPRLHKAVLFGQWGILAPGANALGFVVSDGGAVRID